MGHVQSPWGHARAGNGDILSDGKIRGNSTRTVTPKLPQTHSKKEILKALDHIPQHPDFFGLYHLEPKQKNSIALFVLQCLRREEPWNGNPYWLRRDLEEAHHPNLPSVYFFPTNSVFYFLTKKQGPKKISKPRGKVGSGSFERVEFCVRLSCLPGNISAEIAVASLSKTLKKAQIQKEAPGYSRSKKQLGPMTHRSDYSHLYTHHYIEGSSVTSISELRKAIKTKEENLKALFEIEEKVKGPYAATSYGDGGLYFNKQNYLRRIVFSPFYGVNLIEVITQKGFPWERFWAHAVVGLLKAAHSFLPQAHKNGLFYRDLKLANTLLGTDGTVRFCDFGLSRSLKEGELFNPARGTPLYMAPEMLSLQLLSPLTSFKTSPLTGFKKNYLKADIWAFAITLRNLCQKREEAAVLQPDGQEFTDFDEYSKTLMASPQTTMDAFVNKAKWQETLLEEVKKIVLQTLVVNPEDRWDATQLAEAISKIPEEEFKAFLDTQAEKETPREDSIEDPLKYPPGLAIPQTGRPFWSLSGLNGDLQEIMGVFLGRCRNPENF